MIVTGEELGTKLCKLFGLEPNEVKKITIVAEAGDASKVIVESYILEKGPNCETVLAEYQLKAKT